MHWNCAVMSLPFAKPFCQLGTRNRAHGELARRRTSQSAMSDGMSVLVSFHQMRFRDFITDYLGDMPETVGLRCNDGNRFGRSPNRSHGCIRRYCAADGSCYLTPLVTHVGLGGDYCSTI